MQEAPRSLRALEPQQVKEDFFRLFSDENFIARWDQTCGGREGKCINLRFPPDSVLNPLSVCAWDIPWELLIERLKETNAHATLSLIRSLDVEPPLAPSAFEEPLRVLILQGDDGAGSNSRLDLDKEARLVLKAWGTLNRGLHQRRD